MSTLAAISLAATICHFVEFSTQCFRAFQLTKNSSTQIQKLMHEVHGLNDTLGQLEQVLRSDRLSLRGISLEDLNRNLKLRRAEMKNLKLDLDVLIPPEDREPHQKKLVWTNWEPCLLPMEAAMVTIRHRLLAKGLQPHKHQATTGAQNSTATAYTRWLLLLDAGRSRRFSQWYFGIAL